MISSSELTPTLYSVYSVNSSSAGALLATKTIPLTTILTQPTVCLEGSRFTRNVWADGFVEYGFAFTPECYPSGQASQFTEYLLYSPGVCPHLWNYVATTTSSAYAGGYTTTLAICCPPGFDGLWPLSNDCQEELTTPWPGLSDFPTGTSVIVYERAVTIAWQSSDLTSFSPPSAPALRLAAQTQVAVTSASSTTTSSTISSITSTSAHGSSSAQPSTHKHRSISSGAAAGIGVGATIGVIAVLTGIWIFFRRYRFVPRRQQENLVNDAKASRPSRRSETKSDRQLVEAPNTVLYEAEHPPAEADHRNMRSELET